MDEANTHEPGGISRTRGLDELLDDNLNPDTVEIPAGADRLMPSPASVQSNPTLQQYDREKGRHGQYSWVPGERRVAFNPITDETRAAYTAGVKQWLSEHHDMPFDIDGGIPDDLMMVRQSVSKSYRDLMDIYDRDGRARFITITPTYPGILSAVRERNKEPVAVPMHDTDQGWTLDLRALEHTLRPGDVLILTNPNNPNGYVYTEGDLRQIIALCKKHDVKIISDDVWSDQVHDPAKRHVPIATVAWEMGYANNVSWLFSTGKAFNTAYIPCSVAVVPNAEVRQQLQSGYDDQPSELGSQLAIDTMRSDGDEYVRGLNQRLRKNAELAVSIFREMGCRVHMPESTSVMFIQLNDVVVGHRNVIMRKLASVFHRKSGVDQSIPELMKELKIGFGMGERFGLPGYIRLNIGCPYSVLESRLTRLRNSWQAQMRKT